MFLHTVGFRKTVTLPAYVFDDERLSIGAKGLFVQLYYSNDSICALKDLCSVTKTTEEELKVYFNELAENGYVVITDKKCELKHKAVSERKAKETTTEEVEKYAETTQPKKKSAYEFIVDIINSYDLPNNVKNLLITYFTNWLGKKGRFAEADDLHKNRVMQIIGEFISYHLSEPDMIDCVQQSIDRGWYKLVPPKKDNNSSTQINSFDKTTLTSGSYTKADIEEIKRKAEELEKNGEKGTF
jgi:hypothetical protein